jgi:hypothetical protein
MAKALGSKLQEWITARKRFRLSHAHVQMAREIGLNPRKLGKLANHKQEPWKAPLPDFIEHLYDKRFGKFHPDVVLSIEQFAEALDRKKAAKRAARKARREAEKCDGAPQIEAGPEALEPPVSETCATQPEETIESGVVAKPFSPG